jgi:hypothetical protein
VVVALEGSLCKERVVEGHARMGQHDDWVGALGEVRFLRAASGMLTWPQVNGIR